MSRLNILLLGPPEIRWDDETISIRRRIPRALLFYLASRGSKVSRDSIISIFWQEKSENTARLRFNENLSRLRASLPDPDLVSGDGLLVSLDFNRIYVDQLEFENLIDQAGHIPWQIPENEPLPGNVHNLLQEAADLWRGPHYLPGKIMPSTLSLDAWHSQTAARLEHRLGSILQRLADHAYAVGDLDQALELARTALVRDHLNENLHYRVMLYLIEMGCLNEARSHFNEVQDLLRAELDIRPAAKLIALYRRIRKLHQAYTPETPPNWELHPSISAPFVGRKDILSQIRQVLNQNKAVFLLGEAGQGKTRLIQEYVSQVRPGRRILVTTCRPLETALPFQPICEIFRRHVTPDEWLTLETIWASHLTRLLPEIETMRSDLDSPEISEDPVTAQATLLEAIRQVFVLLNKDHPIILIIDDAHWADEATLSTIAYLISRPPFSNGAALMALARQEEHSQPLIDLLTSVQISKQGDILYLNCLDHKEIGNLTRFILNLSPSPSFVENLAIGTGGNPLFILETLRSMLDEFPEPDLSGKTPIPLAESIHKLIRTRLRKQPLSTRQVLEISAITGAEFNLDLISSVSDRDELDLVHTLDQLEHDLILQSVTSASKEPCYRFTHDKFREVILIDLSPARKRTLHGRIARALEEKQEPAQAAILAHHFESAGEIRKAFEYWVEAGKQARGLFSITDASRSFSEAEKLIPAVEHNLPDDQLYGLYATWSEMAYETQNPELVRRLGDDLLVLGESRQSPLLIGTALDALSDACMTENKFEEGLDFATRAIPYLEQSGNNFEHMEAYIHRGVFLYMLNRIDEAIEAFEDALALGTDESKPEVIRARSNAHYQISLLRTMTGWPERGREHALLSLEDANKSKRTYLQIAAHFVLALSSYYLSQIHKAREYATHGIEMARRTQGWRMLGYLSGYAAATELILGNVDASLAYAREALAIGEEYELTDVISMGYRHQGDIYMLLRSPDKAIPHYERGVEASGQHFLGVDNLIRLGYVRSISGQPETGYQTLAFALAAFENTNLGLGIILAKFFQALAYYANGDLGQARQLASLVKEETSWRSLPSYYLGAVNLLAKTDLQLNNASDPEAFQAIAQESRLIGNIWLELEAQLSAAKISRQAELDDASSKTRIREILAHLKANTKDDSLQDIFGAFEQQVI